MLSSFLFYAWKYLEKWGIDSRALAMLRYGYAIPF